MRQPEHVAPKRAMAAAEEAEVIEATTVSPSRGRRRVGKASVAAGVVGILAVGSLLGWAWTARGGDNEAMSNMADDAAIPAAAAEAVEAGFGDRAEEASRSALRNNLNSAIANEAAKERDASLETVYEDTLEVMVGETAAEREAQIAADMAAVEAQKEKLAAEEAAAQERLLAAAEALRTAGVDTASISNDDLEAATAQGGTMPLKSNYTVGASFGATGSWSRYHTGQDFSAPTGTPIYAAASGIVLSPTSASWAGTNVVIKHMNAGSTLYAHMSSSVVSPGQAVTVGQLIGYVGNTGRSFGSHLHFEYYPAGTTPGDVYTATNPLVFLRSLGVNI